MNQPTNAGEAIRFKRGKYRGLHGFRDTSKKNTLKRSYVIVQLEDQTYKPTYVRHSSIAPPLAKPKNWAEALTIQNPDIDGLIDQLCEQLASCNVGDRSFRVSS